MVVADYFINKTACAFHLLCGPFSPYVDALPCRIQTIQHQCDPIVNLENKISVFDKDRQALSMHFRQKPMPYFPTLPQCKNILSVKKIC